MLYVFPCLLEPFQSAVHPQQICDSRASSFKVSLRPAGRQGLSGLRQRDELPTTQTACHSLGLAEDPFDVVKSGKSMSSVIRRQIGPCLIEIRAMNRK